MPVQEVKSAEQLKKAIGGNKPVAVLFWRQGKPWEPKTDDTDYRVFSELYQGLDYYKADIDAYSDTATEFGITTAPAYVIFQGGEKIKECTGEDGRELGEMFESY
ncbi:hypothetical protein JCM6882_002517 [Rhodosporidiobolus microsporus]